MSADRAVVVIGLSTYTIGCLWWLAFMVRNGVFKKPETWHYSDGSDALAWKVLAAILFCGTWPAWWPLWVLLRALIRLGP